MMIKQLKASGNSVNKIYSNLIEKLNIMGSCNKALKEEMKSG